MTLGRKTGKGKTRRIRNPAQRGCHLRERLWPDRLGHDYWVASWEIDAWAWLRHVQELAGQGVVINPRGLA